MVDGVVQDDRDSRPVRVDCLVGPGALKAFGRDPLRHLVLGPDRASAEGISVSEVIRRALRDYVKASG